MDNSFDLTIMCAIQIDVESDYQPYQLGRQTAFSPSPRQVRLSMTHLHCSAEHPSATPAMTLGANSLARNQAPPKRLRRRLYGFCQVQRLIRLREDAVGRRG
jgi:hypothetical protein